MQIYEYILQNYDKGDPIFLSELVEVFGDNTRQYVKKLIDTGKLERFETGTYFIPYTTILGIKGGVYIEDYIKKKYLMKGIAINGYITGLGFANKKGFTTQNAAVYEICSNEATTRQRKIVVDGFNLIIYKPYIPITKENFETLQFLDLLTNIDCYSELSNQKTSIKLREYLRTSSVDITLLKEYIKYYPAKIFRNAYYGGIINELV